MLNIYTFIYFFPKMTPNHSEVTHALVHSFLLQNEVSLAGPIELQKTLQFTFWMLFRFKFILEYSRANFAIRISCTSPANTYLNMNPYLSFVQGVYLLLKQIALWYQPEHTATLWLCGLIIYSNRLLPVITLPYGRIKFQGPPTSIFGKYRFGRRFEI